jgi:CheY-like chemotaxis protein
MAFPRVLIVDDDRWLIQTLEREMRPRVAQWNVVATCDALRALEVVAAGDLDVLVTDVDMPTVGGRALVRRARRHARRIPIILLTGGEPDGGLVRAVEEVLYKPFLPSTLDAVIASMLLR